MMKRLLLPLLLLLVLASAAFAQETPEVTVIPTVMKRDIAPSGQITAQNPAVPGKSPTTGLPLAGQPYVPILMQVDNSLGALPHWGILDADIMYELPISGGGFMRLTALFADKHPTAAGPVRSARVMHADLREEWDALFLHYGEQTAAGSNYRVTVRSYGVIDKGLEIDGIGNKYAKQFTRTKYHGAPHNVSADVKYFHDLMLQSGYQFPLRPFLFQDGVIYEGPDAVKISVVHQENPDSASSFLYDQARRQYLRYTYKGIYYDLLNPQEPLMYANVIVQRTPLKFNRRSSNPLLPDVVGGGAADIFIGGKYVAGAWTRASLQSRTIFHDGQGNEIVLQPGRTWIILAHEETVVSYEGEYEADTDEYFAKTGRLPVYRPLKVDDRGDEVRALKQRLFELKYLRSSNFNNRFTAELADVVRQFQADNGLEQTGRATSLTLDALFGADPAATTQVLATATTEAPTTPVPSPAPLATPEAQVTPTPAADIPPTPVPTAAPSGEEDVSLGGDDTAIPEVTPAPAREPEATPAPDAGPTPDASAVVRTGNGAPLNMRRRTESDSPLVGRIPDGSTVLVLEQGAEWTRVGFAGVDGYVMTRFLEFTAPAETPASDYETLTVGDRGVRVRALKQRFFELGYFRTDSFNDVFQQNTADTVMRFEKRNGLPEDGIADPRMQELLFSNNALRP